MTDAEKLEKNYLTMYPSQNELRETDERQCAAMHNYIVIGQAQIFIRRIRTKYAICTRGWRPGKYHYKGGYMEITRTESLRQAKEIFISAAAKLIEEEYIKWVAYSLSQSNQEEKQSKHLAEIAQIVEQLGNSPQ